MGDSGLFPILATALLIYRETIVRGLILLLILDDIGWGQRKM